MKKSYKLFLLALIVSFISTVPVFAREMTVQELGDAAAAQYKDKRVGYIYVVGEYAFTSQHTLTTQDLMLAARSIKVTDANKNGETNADGIYGEMALQTLTAKRDPVTGETSEWTKSKLFGTTTLEDKFNIRYIDYVFQPEESKVDINFDLSDTSKYQTYTGILKDKLNFEADKFYGKNEQGQHVLEYKDGKLTGILLKNESVTLNPTDQAKNGKYFFALVVEVPNATDDVTVKLENLNGTITAKKDDFDVKPGDNGKTPGIVILVPIDPADFAKTENQTMTLTIDADGDKNKEYGSNVYTIDISGLTLQAESTFATDITTISEDDKKTIFEEWGYDDKVNKNLALGTDGKLTGTLVEQELKSEKVYGAENKKGYYYYFTFVLPNGIDTSKVKIEQLESEKGESAKKTFVQSEYSDGNLTLFPRIAPGTSLSDNNGKMYFRIDLDGEGDLYYPTYFTLDYSGVTLEKSSFFTVSGLSDGDEKQYDEHDWYDKNNGYSVTVEQDETDAHKYNVSGVLPIFEDEGVFDGESDPFDPKEVLYYLGLKLTLDADTKIETSGEEKITVKFFHNDDEEDSKFLKVFGDDFDSSNALYILKALSPDDEREFTITVDLDGEGVEYEAYTVTIDWSDLSLQLESKGDFGNYEVISESELTEGSQEKTDLTNYEFDFDADAEVSVKTEEDPEHGEVKQGLTGNIKEQTLKEGTFDDNNGFFVPIKIEFPGKDIDELQDYADKWTIILNTEKGEKKTYTPTAEEYAQGWVLVLFRIDNGDDKYIRYQIDFDGNAFEFVPQDYTISYQELNFLNAHKVSIKGTDETITVYDNDKITKELLEEIIPEASDKYHELESVVDSEDQDFIGQIIEAEDDDFEITVNWKLDADEFVDDVIADLNSTSTTNSNDFSDDFTLSRDNDDITITLKHPGIPLTDLADTSIPGAIAYVLGQNEITKVTLGIGSQNIDITNSYKASSSKSYTDEADRQLLDEEGQKLKEEIIKGAKDAFDKELDNHEDTATLDQLEYDDITFTIKVSETADNIKVVGEEGTEETEKTYTFKFDSDFAVVDQDGNLGAQDLSEAIADGNNYSTVYIDGDYTATTPIQISRDVVIAPVEDAQAVKAMAEDPTKVSITEQDYIFDVKSGKVTISDLELTGAKKADIYVENGATVTADSIKITAEKDQIDEGILVGPTGRINVTDLTFENETHDTPAIRAQKDSSERKGTVVGQGLTSQYNPIIDVKHHDQPWCTSDPSKEGAENLSDCKDVNYSDEYNTVDGDTFYYVNSSNYVEYYLIGFMNNYSIKAGMTRVFKKGEIDKPIDLLDKHKTAQGKNSESLYFVGYGTVRGDDQNYSDLITDWTPYHFEKNGDWFFAMYVEQAYTITVDNNITGLGLESYKGKTYKTYKFTDKNEGMTIGELKKVDPEFDKMWKAVEAANVGGHGKITIDEVEATDKTKINSNVTLKVTTQAEMG